MILAELREGAKSVNDLVASTGLKQPNVSNHLARLRTRGVVRATKVGRQVFYSFFSPEIESIILSAFRTRQEVDDEFTLSELPEKLGMLAILGDQIGLNRIIDSVLRAGYKPLEIYQEIISPTLNLVNLKADSSDIDIAQYRIAFSAIDRVLARIAHQQMSRAWNGRVAMLGCITGEHCVVELRMVSDYLCATGWRSLFMGPDIPVENFLSAIERHRPSVVILGHSGMSSLNKIIDLVRAIKRDSNKYGTPFVGVSGKAVTQNVASLTDSGADLCSEGIREFASRFSSATFEPLEPVSVDDLLEA